MMGFVDQFQSNALQTLLGESWILVNTSVREGLPTSFLEALANKCALLSSVNPAGVTERFGHFVENDNFAVGLEALLENNAWSQKGEAGWEYVRNTFEIEAVLDRHMEIYNGLMSLGRRK